MKNFAVHVHTHVGQARSARAFLSVGSVGSGVVVIGPVPHGQCGRERQGYVLGPGGKNALERLTAIGGWGVPPPKRPLEPDFIAGKITSQRLLDQSQAGVYMGKTPHTPHFGPIRVPYPKGLNC